MTTLHGGNPSADHRDGWPVRTESLAGRLPMSDLDAKIRTGREQRQGNEMDTYEGDGNTYLTPQASERYRQAQWDHIVRSLPVMSLAWLLASGLFVWRVTLGWEGDPVTGWWWLVWAGNAALLVWIASRLVNLWRSDEVRDRRLRRHLPNPPKDPWGGRAKRAEYWNGLGSRVRPPPRSSPPSVLCLPQPSTGCSTPSSYSGASRISPKSRVIDGDTVEAVN